MAKASFKTRAKSWGRIWHANVGIATALTLGAIAISCPFIAHKGGDLAIGKTLMDIHYGKFLPKEWEWLWIDFQGAALLFLIVSGWMIHHRMVKKAATQAADDPSAPGSSVTIIWESGRPATQTEARKLAVEAEEHGLRAFVVESARYASNKLMQERWLVCVLSGESGALPFKSSATKLPRLEFAVMAADAGATERCAELGSQLSASGAKSFASPGRVAGEVNADILAHLARHVKAVPAAKVAARPVASATA
jgi:hypothetical protein